MGCIRMLKTGEPEEPSCVSARYWTTSSLTNWTDRVSSANFLKRAPRVLDDDDRVVLGDGPGVPRASGGRSTRAFQSDDRPVVRLILADPIGVALEHERIAGETLLVVEVGGDRLDVAVLLVDDVVMIGKDEVGLDQEAGAEGAVPGEDELEVGDAARGLRHLRRDADVDQPAAALHHALQMTSRPAAGRDRRPSTRRHRSAGCTAETPAARRASRGSAAGRRRRSGLRSPSRPPCAASPGGRSP